MNRRLLPAFVLSAGLAAGCALPPGPTDPTAGAAVYRIDTPFDSGLAARLAGDGPNTVTGRASIRLRDGRTASCAGQAVYLVPATEYARIRIKALYGSDQRGVRLDSRSPRFEPDPSEYSRLVRRARCDEQGVFRFEQVASGSFFVTAVVRAPGSDRHAGGSLMQAIVTSGGRTTDLSMVR